MKVVVKLVVHVGALGAVALASSPTTLSAQIPGPPAVRTVGPLADSLRAFAFRMAELLRKRDAAGVIGLYDDLPHFVHVDNGVVTPWSQLSTLMMTFFATAKSNPVSVIGEPGVTILDDNNVVVYIAHRSDATEGRPAHEGVWTGVLRRFPGGWKIVHSHSSERR